MVTIAVVLIVALITSLFVLMAIAPMVAEQSTRPATKRTHPVVRIDPVARSGPSSTERAA